MGKGIAIACKGHVNELVIDASKSWECSYIHFEQQIYLLKDLFDAEYFQTVKTLSLNSKDFFQNIVLYIILHIVNSKREWLE